jgi:hypothetical protein
MKKYKFSKKYDFWTTDHHANFSYIKFYFDRHYELVKRDTTIYLSFLEIGIFEGRTSIWLLDNVLKEHIYTKKGGVLHCIDPALTKNGQFNLAQHKGNVIYYNELSSRVLIRLLQENLGLLFDFIFVDGDHNACNLLEDLVLSWKLLRVEGIMLIDDYEMETTDPWHYISHPEFTDNPKLRFTHPRIAIDAFLSIYRGQYDLIIDNYQIGIKKTVDF